MLLVVAATQPELAGATGLAHVEALACGIGPVEAAATTAARLASAPRPSALLHVGIAGARRAAAIAPGTIVIGTRATYCDTRSRLVVAELHPEASLLAAARAALPTARTCVIGTSADVDGSHGCDVEAMEGFGVLHAAALAGVPALEVRAVSNEIEEPDRSNWRFDVGLDALERALPKLVAAVASVA